MVHQVPAIPINARRQNISRNFSRELGRRNRRSRKPRRNPPTQLAAMYTVHGFALNSNIGPMKLYRIMGKALQLKKLHSFLECWHGKLEGMDTPSAEGWHRSLATTE